MSAIAVIGGGFYGASIAIHLKTVRKIDRVMLFERAPDLLTRGSFANQARIHRGHHYPRSLPTAHRSLVNAPRFEADFGPAVFAHYTALYAVARRNSHVTARQMERFCGQLGAPLAAASPEYRRLFDPALVAGVYRVTEHAFDADILRGEIERRLHAAGIEIRTGHEVTQLTPSDQGVALGWRAGDRTGAFAADAVFNCTYSQVSRLSGAIPGLHHQISEIVLVEPPAEFADMGVTIMDGPFFSMMPFPARGLHSLTHVRYTPHQAWDDDAAIDPYRTLADYHCETRADRMLRDAARYIPSIATARPRASLFEVKTVRRQQDDGRPILFERDATHGRIFSVLGGKIDNVYDVLDRLDAETLPG